MLKDLAFPAKRELLPQMLTKIGDEIKLKVNRDGKEIDITVKLGEQP